MLYYVLLTFYINDYHIVFFSSDESIKSGNSAGSSRQPHLKLEKKQLNNSEVDYVKLTSNEDGVKNALLVECVCA